jgi:tRNA-dihydrouridine synthase
MTPKLYIAPVRGITDMIYRNAFAECFDGIDVAMTPFLTVIKGNQLKKLQLDELRPENNSLPIIPQIIGKSANNFLTLSDTLYDIGIEEINWNLGCPHPTMTKKRQGSGLLPHPDLIELFLKKVCSKIKTKLSVKVRLGLESPDELERLIPIFNQFPIVELTIHPRLGKQMYKGEVNLDGFGTALALSKLPVVYNGDIFNKADFERISSRFPQINKFMLGRGLFANPFLAEEIKGSDQQSDEERIKRLKAFHNELLKRYRHRLSGDAHLIRKMCEHWQYLAESFPNGKQFYKKLKKAKTLSDFEELVDKLIVDC